MESNSSCPCCGSLEARPYWALVAPFLRNYALGTNAPYTAQLRECRQCGHRFFRERFTTEEMENIYGGYRNRTYLKTRQKLEPWYTARLNGAGMEQSQINRRQEQLRNLLLEAGWKPGEKRVVLDVGGDVGQNIPLDLAKAAYLLEVSDRQITPGVQRVKALTEVPESIGLILCLHVIEHLPNPEALLREWSASGKLGTDCIIILEVPLERPHLLPLLSSKLYRGWLEFVGRFLPLTIALDACATAARGLLRLVMPPLFLKLHEHVQFFTERSLAQFASQAGLNIIRLETTRGSSLLTHQGAISLVGRLTNSSSLCRLGGKVDNLP